MEDTPLISIKGIQIVWPLLKDRAARNGAGSDERLYQRPLLNNATASQIGVYTAESIKQVTDAMHTATFYINPKGGLMASPRIDTVERVIIGMASRSK